MIEDELIKIWQSSPNQERVKFEKSRLMIDMQGSMDKLHRSIKYRDLRENAAIAIIIPAFALSAYAIPFPLTKIASVLIIVWAVYVGIRLRNAKKRKPGAFYESYLDYLHKTRDYLSIQKKMLESVLYWYILPGMTLTMLFAFGFPASKENSNYIIRMGVLNVLMAVAIYWLNKNAVKKEFIPRLRKVDELIQVMEQS